MIQVPTSEIKTLLNKTQKFSMVHLTTIERGKSMIVKGKNKEVQGIHINEI